MLRRRRRSAVSIYIVVSTTLLIFLLARTYLTSEPHKLNTAPIIIHLTPRKLPVNPPVVRPTTKVVVAAVEETSKKPPVHLPKRKGYDEFQWPQRLGSGLGKEFQIRPTPWQLRWNRSVATVSPGTVKKILLYDTFTWWQFKGTLDCPLAPQLHCQMKDNDRDDDWETLAADIDAAIFVRDFAHTEEVTKELAITPNVTAIYFTLESPHAGEVEVPLKPRRVFFGSYWRGADIYAPYSRWLSYDPKVTHKPPGKNYAAGRTKMAAIVVSNCQTSNNRMGYVKELKKYIQVDIYGSCGKLSCPENSDCFHQLKADYKFYLALENSNCRDYITEKFYLNALQHDMVPVVMGAHPEDYAAVAPAHSYIHVEQFSTIKALADYLKLLHSNDTLYNEYFAWKGTGNFSPIHFLCEACAFVHAQKTPGFKYQLPDSPQSFLNSEQEIYADGKFDWDSSNAMLCLAQDEWYWNNPLPLMKKAKVFSKP